MSDNTRLNVGEDGDLYRSIDKGGPKTQVVTIDVGGAGAESLVAGTVPVSGTVTSNLSATDNAVLDAIDALLTTINSKLVTGTVIGDVNVVSVAAGDAQADHDAAVPAAVIMTGVVGRNTEPTAVGTTGDATRILGTMLGKPVTVPYAIPASTWSYASPAAVTDTADDAAKASAGAGIRNYITGVQVFNGHDTVGTEVVIKDGSTVLWRGWAEQTGGGCSARFDPPLRGTAATAVNVANITTGSATYFNLQGFISAE